MAAANLNNTAPLKRYEFRSRDLVRIAKEKAKKRVLNMLTTGATQAATAAATQLPLSTVKWYVKSSLSFDFLWRKQMQKITFND